MKTFLKRVNNKKIPSSFTHRLNSTLSIDDFIQPKEEQKRQMDNHFKPKDFNLQLEKKTGNLLSVDKYVELIEKFKGMDMVVMNLQNRTNYTDYMIFVTGSKKRKLNSKKMDTVT
jgi:hypothetical protein